MSVNEGAVLSQRENEANSLYNKYEKHMDLLEGSMLSRVRPIDSMDHYALGKSLESYSLLEEELRESSSLSSLGPIPQFAFDVITTSYASSPISAIASTQPIEEQSGNVYYRAVKAATTRGNMTAGDEIFGAPLSTYKGPEGFTTDQVTEVAATTAASTVDYNFNLAQAPVRPYSVVLTLADDNDIITMDDGKGNILGKGLSGTINYVTGAVSVSFTSQPAQPKALSATYATDFEEASDVPRITSGLVARNVKAQVFVLADTMGLLQSFTMRKRFGMAIDDMVIEDLVSTINSEVMTQAIKKLSAAAVSTENFDLSRPDGVAYVDHKQELKDAIVRSELNLISNAGRGQANVIIAGLRASGYLSTLPGFEALSDGNNIGPHVFGRLDGRLIVRVPGTELDTNTLLLMFKGPTSFEGALVYSPYMPLMTTAALPSFTNPLQSQIAAVQMAGVDVMVPQYVTKLTISGGQ